MGKLACLRYRARSLPVYSRINNQIVAKPMLDEERAASSFDINKIREPGLLISR